MAAVGWSQLQDNGSRLSDKMQPGASSFLWERRCAPGLQVIPGPDLWFWCVTGQCGHWLPGLLRPPVAHSREREWVAERPALCGNGLYGGCCGGAMALGLAGVFFGVCPPVGVKQARDTQSSWPGRKS